MGKVLQFPRRPAPYPSSVDGLSVYSPDGGTTWRIAKQVGGRRHEVTLTTDEMETIALGWAVVKEGLGQ